MKYAALPTSLVVYLAGAMLGLITLIGLLMYAGTIIHTKATSPPQGALATIVLPASALSAKAAIIYDPTTGKVVYQKNAELTLPLASLTKLMTADVVLSSVATSTLVTITAQNISADSDAGDWGLKTGDVVSVGDLLKIGLVASSNYAMSAAAGSLGSAYVDDLNQGATRLGLSHTYFLNPTGLDINTAVSGGYGSAYDVARLAAVFLKKYPQYFELSSQPSVTVEASGHAVSADATTVPLQDIPGFIGAKTGYTDLAGGNLVMAYDIDINHPLIAVVLGSTEEGRFTDIRTLVNASRAAEQAGAAPSTQIP